MFTFLDITFTSIQLTEMTTGGLFSDNFEGDLISSDGSCTEFEASGDPHFGTDQDKKGN